MTKRVLTQTFGVVGAILERDGKILLTKEVKEVAKGLWSHPAGWIEVGENPIESVKREVKEETGLSDIEIVEKLDIKSDYWFVWEGEKVHKFQNFFLVKASRKDQIKLSIEHSDYKWCKYDEALRDIKYNKEQFKKAYKELKKAQMQ